jgi:hypothetical protein
MNAFTKTVLKFPLFESQEMCEQGSPSSPYLLPSKPYAEPCNATNIPIF